MLEIKNLKASINNKQILKGLNLQTYNLLFVYIIKDHSTKVKWSYLYKNLFIGNLFECDALELLYPI